MIRVRTSGPPAIPVDDYELGHATLVRDEAVVLSGISRVAEQRDERAVSDIDAAVNPVARDVHGLTGCERDGTGPTVKRLEKHDALPTQTVIELRTVRLGVELSARYGEFVP